MRFDSLPEGVFEANSLVADTYLTQVARNGVGHGADHLGRGIPGVAQGVLEGLDGILQDVFGAVTPPHLAEREAGAPGRWRGVVMGIQRARYLQGCKHQCRQRVLALTPFGTTVMYVVAASVRETQAGLHVPQHTCPCFRVWRTASCRGISVREKLPRRRGACPKGNYCSMHVKFLAPRPMQFFLQPLLPPCRQILTLNQQVSMSWLPGQLGGLLKGSRDPPALAWAFSSLTISARNVEFSA